MIFIGVGSSIGNAEKNFKKAQECLEQSGLFVVKKSKILSNKPYGGIAQNIFSNAVWQLKSRENLTSHQLLNILKTCEVKLGRNLQAKRWSDRIIDLDILMFHDEILKSKILTIPHQEIQNRIFVLEPWQELVDKNFEIPKLGRLAKILEKLKTNSSKNLVKNMNDLNITTEDAVKVILKNIGEDPEREGLLETPKRVAKAHKEFFAGYSQDPKKVLKTFTNEGYEEMLLVKDIEYYSHCEHHMVPFFGKAHVAYIPDEKITGLSKIPRLIEIFAKRLQNQERLTAQIANTLYKELNAKGVAVYIDGKHLCMCARGVEKTNSKTITTAFLGDFKTNCALRSDFFMQINKEF
jgi:GTP cyclohydrolase I